MKTCIPLALFFFKLRSYPYRGVETKPKNEKEQEDLDAKREMDSEDAHEERCSSRRNGCCKGKKET